MDKVKVVDNNPFEDTKVAREWINSVENESGSYRDTEVYPRLGKWINEAVQNNAIVVDIGSGQGVCSEHLAGFSGNYIGIEPSEDLTARAQQLYGDNRQMRFVIGDANNLPIDDESIDAGFSIMVWFHIKDIRKASAELSRILKLGGKFFIVTANPNALKIWRSFYFDYKEDDIKIVGKVNVPVNPMSNSIFYKHTEVDIISALQDNGLLVTKTSEFGLQKDENLFMSFTGEKM
jgi:ubiquinone/menaquinone biosynthesis C-methylase UbiE